MPLTEAAPLAPKERTEPAPKNKRKNMINAITHFMDKQVEHEEVGANHPIVKHTLCILLLRLMMNERPRVPSNWDEWNILGDDDTKIVDLREAANDLTDAANRIVEVAGVSYVEDWLSLADWLNDVLDLEVTVS